MHDISILKRLPLYICCYRCSIILPDADTCFNMILSKLRSVVLYHFWKIGSLTITDNALRHYWVSIFYGVQPVIKTCHPILILFFRYYGIHLRTMDVLWGVSFSNDIGQSGFPGSCIAASLMGNTPNLLLLTIEERWYPMLAIVARWLSSLEHTAVNLYAAKS